MEVLERCPWNIKINRHTSSVWLLCSYVTNSGSIWSSILQCTHTVIIFEASKIREKEIV